MSNSYVTVNEYKCIYDHCRKISNNDIEFLEVLDTDFDMKRERVTYDREKQDRRVYVYKDLMNNVFLFAYRDQMNNGCKTSVEKKHYKRFTKLFDLITCIYILSNESSNFTLKLLNI